jgi:DNA-3-methyladenine glycosylase
MVKMRVLQTKNLRDASEAAQYLLGCDIVRTLPDGERLRMKIVETEAYHQDDPASHTFRGKTDRNRAMFGPAGHAYVYFTYGMHWCFNVTAGKEGYGAGILIRAGEPLEGIDRMRENRCAKGQATLPDRQLSNGPAKLVQALGITKELYGHNLTQPPLQVFEALTQDFAIRKTTRIGISQAVDAVARYYIVDNPFVSRR